MIASMQCMITGCSDRARHKATKVHGVLQWQTELDMTCFFDLQVVHAWPSWLLLAA